MKAGACATFVVPWRDVELDGECPAPDEPLTVGASWRRLGPAVALDGQGELLRLSGDQAGAALRARAGRRVGRGTAAAATVARDEADMLADMVGPQPVFSRAMVLTDGRRRYDAALIPHRDGPLFAFDGDVPPAGAELWIVRLPAPRRDAGAPMPPSFAAGCPLRTEAGEAAAETITPGQRLVVEGGLATVTEVRRHRLSGARLAALPELSPVRLGAGALGGGMPRRDLLLGPAHRLRLCHPGTRILWGAGAAIVAAGDLEGWPGIRREHPVRGFDFFEPILDGAGFVEAAGVACESGPDVGDAPAAGHGRALTRGEAAILAHHAQGSELM